MYRRVIKGAERVKTGSRESLSTEAKFSHAILILHIPTLEFGNTKSNGGDSLRKSFDKLSNNKMKTGDFEWSVPSAPVDL